MMSIPFRNQPGALSIKCRNGLQTALAEPFDSESHGHERSLTLG